MAETYCGKNCAECTDKEKLGCTGCKAVTGKLWQEECELAKCCKDKGHQTCETCIFHETCAIWRRRNNIPEQRLRKRADEEERKEKIMQKSRTLGKWLWVLFWLVIPMILASVMTNESIAAWFPFLNFPGKFLNITCSAAYGVILLILSSEERHYRISGICALVAAVVSLLLINVPIGVNEAITMGALVLTLPAAVVSLIGEYHEYMGHAEVAGDVDADLSEKWSTLWKWYMGMFAGLFGGLFVMLIIPILGLLVLLAAAIGFLVVSILKLVYLYRTANLFRRYAQTENDTVEKSF